MLGTYIDIILYPVRQLLGLLVDPRLTEHLGVSVLGIAVTSAIVLIVVTALVTRINAGDLANSVFSVVRNKERSNHRESDRGSGAGRFYSSKGK